MPFATSDAAASDGASFDAKATMTAEVCLIYPPACDPTAPYLAVPMLTGFLRERDVSVLPIDANLDGFDAILSPMFLLRAQQRIQRVLAELGAKATLTHEEQLRYAASLNALGDALAAPTAIDAAKATFRDAAKFYESATYDSAVRTVDSALRAISAAHYPLHLDFTAYRTPFGLLSQAEILAASAPEFDPFDEYVRDTLIPQVRASGARVVGISVCFPGQLQPAYAMAWKLKAALPGVHIVGGGPGLTQMMIRLSGHALAEALGPFDSAVVFEGEHTLYELVLALRDRRPLRSIANLVIRDKLQGARYLSGHGMVDLKPLPAPDFAGLPLERYFAPQVTIPYDPTRGCYWGKCTFCHYGLAEVGTATYRERDVATMVEHLAAMAAKYNTKHFYFSQDSVAPKTILKLADGIIEAGLQIHWATDLKPEKYLTQERAQRLRDAGAVACALGVESGSDRVLKLIDKGPGVSVVSDVVARLAAAGVAAEAMCFTDFPTETAAEALQTLEFLEARKDQIGVYIVGEFGLTHGALVAQEPSKFDIAETFQLDGDKLGLSLFFTPNAPWKSAEERARINAQMVVLGDSWALRSYPWAGAVSTAHTLMYYARFGQGAFRDVARRAEGAIPGAQSSQFISQYALSRVELAESREAAIWQTLVYEKRHVSRDAYLALAAASAVASPQPTTYQIAAGAGPIAARKRQAGKRPSHAHSSASKASS
jgi:anaerobic magnesium-protoporphyrin IX monomethyl ester cyclase